MRGLFTNKYFVLLLTITVFLLVMMAIYTDNREKVTFGEDLVGAVVMPFQTLFTASSNGVAGFFDYFADAKRLTEENKQMSEKIDELNNTIRNIDEFKLENERLKSMLDLKKGMGDYDLIGAEVIAKDPGNWFNTFTIDKGTSSGLAVRQAVITSKGLVGYIYEIGTNYAKVVTIIDTNSSTGSLVVRTRDIAMIEGDLELGMDGLCRMTYISKDASVITGDLIETSGLGGIYPKGILIGKIREIRPETQSVSQYAVVEPVVDFQRITEVFVIKTKLP